MPLKIIRQDITQMNCYAIVNPTNENMIGHSGVDLAIHTIAGPGLDAECRKLAPLGLGQAKISGAYNLPCKYVIHTSGPIQIRLAEALTILPVFTSAAIPGLFIGCVLANFMSGCLVWDVVFGSLATLIGALCTHLLRKTSQYLAVLPPILANMVIVPAVLQYVYGEEQLYWILMLSVGIGEVISAGVGGLLLHKTLTKTKLFHK